MKKILFIGQAPPSNIADKPFGRTMLYKWLSNIGLNDFEEHSANALWNKSLLSKYKSNPVMLNFTALVDFFPGKNKTRGDIVPTHEQIINNKLNILYELNKNPDIVIPIGKLAIGYCFYGYDITKKQYSKLRLSDVIGKNYITKPFDLITKKFQVIPFPHPSGASVWYNLPDNKLKVFNALRIVEELLS